MLGQTNIEATVIDAAYPWLRDLAPRIRGLLETEALYAGYLHRQEADIKAFRREETVGLDAAIDYGQIGGLSTELREKLAQIIDPASLRATRLQFRGMTPAALAAMLYDAFAQATGCPGKLFHVETSSRSLPPLFH